MPLPDDLMLDEPQRGARLIREFYERYHERLSEDGLYGEVDAPYDARQADFFRRALSAHGHGEGSLGLDVGCRGGGMIRAVGMIRWMGADADRKALEVARGTGIPCAEMDFTAAINFRDETLDVVMMTAVLEHLPYPVITVGEVHRVLKKRPGSLFVGMVPLDYHLHRRWKVMRGKRLSGDQTHVHHFSYWELDELLRFFFEEVEYLPLSGTAARHPWLPYRHFVRDIAWAASGPKTSVGRWDSTKKGVGMSDPRR